MSVWQIAEYSLVVSVVALLILGMKRLFHDKLDARWHYFIWLVLGVRMVVPLSLTWLKSSLSLFEAIPVHYWIGLWRLKAVRAGIMHFMEVLPKVYVVGVLLFGMYYVITAIVVRIKVLRLRKADEEIYDLVNRVAEKYGLKACKRIRVGQGAMPCVCGLICPILVLPEENVYEEVILHELLHQKYGDVWINYVLHVVRAVNWFNPLIWYVTAVILNDSEALCDQRVLACMTSKNELPAEKIYGNLLINMAVCKGTRSAKIGTTNMANSYRSMNTRIKRIADFKKVPAGLGFAALCITLLLSVSAVSYCESVKIISCGIEDEKDLERVILRAQTYQAESKEEAIYLYMKSMIEMNPIYLLPVVPKEEAALLEEWIYEMFHQDMFIRWQVDGKSYVGNAEDAYYTDTVSWINFREKMIENPWFVWNGNRMTDCWIYNFHGDEVRGLATAELYILEDEVSFVNWNLELLYENGWKVKRLGEEVFKESAWQSDQEPLIWTEAEGGDWLITAFGYNEANFNSLCHTNTSLRVYQGKVPTLREKEEAAEYPQQFDIQYKNTRVFATYQGEEPLENIQIRLVCQMYDSAEEVALIATENEVKDVEEAWQEAREWSGDTSTEPPEITSGGFSSSSGEGSRYLNGKTVEKGDKILLTGGGGGYDGWLGTEELHFVVWIYYDGECVEVIKK